MMPAVPIPQRLLVATATIQADPHFETALMGYARRLTALYRGRPEAVTIIGDLGRFGTVAAIATAGKSASIRQIADRLNGPGIISRRRATAHVRRLHSMKAVAAATDSGRGGGTRWQLSPFVEPMLHAWVSALAGPALYWHSRPWPDLDDPAILRSFLDQVLSGSRRGFSAFAGLPRIGRLFQLTAGHALLMELALASTGRPDEPFSLSRTGVASAYGVSRSHVRDMLGQLRDDGSIVAAGSCLALTSAFSNEIRDWVARSFVLANACLAGRLLSIAQGEPLQ